MKAQNQYTLADRARWFAEHRNDPSAAAIVAYVRNIGMSDPTKVDDLDRHLNGDQAVQLAELITAFDAGTVDGRSWRGNRGGRPSSPRSSDASARSRSPESRCCDTITRSAASSTCRSGSSPPARGHRETASSRSRDTHLCKSGRKNRVQSTRLSTCPSWQERRRQDRPRRTPPFRQERRYRPRR